jgi:pimeloyl-ACP methyl ester carboxylesterase
MTPSVLLVHGGLWDAMDAETFWGTTGLTTGLSAALPLHTLLAPDRPQRPAGWDIEVAALSERLTAHSGPVRIVGASNGCTIAVLLALRFPELVDRLLLAWPATGGDGAVDARARDRLVGRGCPADVADGLLGGGILRGVSDDQVASLDRIRVAVLPSVPENPAHQRKTVDALLRSIRGSRELTGCPEPPTPGFRPHLDQLVRTIVEFVN